MGTETKTSYAVLQGNDIQGKSERGRWDRVYITEHLGLRLCLPCLAMACFSLSL